MSEELEDQEAIDEARKKVRVSSTGKKTKRLNCKPGYRQSGNKCVKMSSQERKKRQKAAKKAVKSKRGKSQASAKRKRAKAMKKRKSYGY